MNVKKRLPSLVPLLLLAAVPFLQARVPLPVLTRPVDHPPIKLPDPFPGVLAQQAILVNLSDALRSAREQEPAKLELNVLNIGPLVLVRDSVVKAPNGDLVWQGHVDGQPESVAIYSVAPNHLVADIVTQADRGHPARYFQIRFLGDRVHIVREVDQRAYPPELPPDPPDKIDAAKKDDPNSPERDAPQPTCSTDPAGTIDVLVVFTPAVTKALNGPDLVKSEINIYVAEANRAYSHSGISQQLRLVQAQEVPYTEDGDTLNDRRKLRMPGGDLGDVHRLRDTYGADVVALIVEYDSTTNRKHGCGISYIMEDASNDFESWAFSVIPQLCAGTPIFSFTHELGHLMGARHDWYVEKGIAGNRKPFAFSHGFVRHPSADDPNSGFTTVMAYPFECQDSKDLCPRRLNFSNPDRRVPRTQIPMGVAAGDQPANNARTLNATAKTVANFRCRTP